MWARSRLGRLLRASCGPLSDPTERVLKGNNPRPVHCCVPAKHWRARVTHNMNCSAEFNDRANLDLQQRVAQRDNAGDPWHRRGVAKLSRQYNSTRLRLSTIQID